MNAKILLDIVQKPTETPNKLECQVKVEIDGTGAAITVALMEVFRKSPELFKLFKKAVIMTDQAKSIEEIADLIKD
ncbi:hypothetical protein [Flavobacterium suncheonense]|uniref:Uncharacterized protein n=1 Tax=Flavobacterium suncheonense GH29-5 = DSM 17707 TaxID=1121899 RepID=A0A0A2MEA6_9FLAO|nr:hypothetical protein [Flavobacterium suncheonense]KGO89763.1 hypothetical protein Q764_06130 [Flavobacterium suncheonense GH29-5 = DSM 17707]